MSSTHTANLHLPNLPEEATRTELFPALGTTNLLSIGKLCDAECTCTFTKDKAIIKKDNQIIMQGTRTDSAPKLWTVKLPPEPETQPHVAATAVNLPTKVSDLVAFSHGALFSPTIKTLAEALRKEFIVGFPGLTKESLAHHPPQSIATIKGHLDQSRTKSKRKRRAKDKPSTNKSDPNPDDDDDIAPKAENPNIRTHYCYAAIVELTGQVYSDQTGPFPITSSSGYKYIFCIYDFDSNLIDGTPLRDKSGPSILAAYKVVFSKLKQAGLTPKLARLDNECSTALKEYMTDEGVEFQLVPPYIHRRNAAERAIRTFKNHFIAGIATCDKKFPIHLWDKLLPQANLTLNLLRASRINPKLSAYAQVFGTYNYNSHPIGPPGTLVMIHEKPNQRKSWAPHAIEGWYVGPSMEHYRCYNIWNPATRHMRIADTLTWLPTKVPSPLPTDAERITAAIEDITEMVKNNTPNQTQLVQTNQLDELNRIKEIFTPNLSPQVQETPDYVESDYKARASSNISDDADIVSPTEDQARRPTTRSMTRHDNEKIDKSTAEAIPAPKATRTPLENILYAPSRHTEKVFNTPLLRVEPKGPETPGTKGRFVAAVALLAEQEQNTQILQTAGSNWEETCYKAVHPDTGEAVEYKDLVNSSEGYLWTECCAEEIGRLAQGYKCTVGTNTIHFIKVSDVPPGRKATYLRLVVADRPNKENPR